jgi:hypothetical protein
MPFFFNQLSVTTDYHVDYHNNTQTPVAVEALDVVSSQENMPRVVLAIYI